jgi:hypothetical protein
VHNDDTLSALAMEIVDALTVIATPGWTSLALSIGRREGRPYAHSIVANERTSSAPRAELGLDLGEVRAALDEALSDVDQALGARGVASEMHVTRDGDHRAAVALLSEDKRLLAESVLDERHLPHRVYTEALYAAAREASAIDAGQKRLADEAQGHDDWEYDAKTARLELKKGVLPWRSYRAQVVGTWAKESETFLWAWANQELPETSTDLAKRARQSALAEPGLGALRRPHLPADEPFASALARLAAARAGARGVYPAAYDHGVIYLAVVAD